MSWLHLHDDGKHAIYKCSECKRWGVTFKGATAGALGDCVCKKGAPPRGR